MLSVLSYVLLFAVMWLINMVVVWIGLVITGLSTSFRGLAILCAAFTVPHLFLPGLIAIPISAVIFWVLTLKLTTAEGVSDVVLLNVVTNVVSFGLSFFVFMRVVGPLSLIGHDDSSTVIPDVSARSLPSPDVHSDDGDRESSVVVHQRSAYDALRGQLSAEEIAAIEQSAGSP